MSENPRTRPSSCTLQKTGSMLTTHLHRDSSSDIKKWMWLCQIHVISLPIDSCDNWYPSERLPSPYVSRRWPEMVARQLTCSFITTRIVQRPPPQPLSPPPKVDMLTPPRVVDLGGPAKHVHLSTCCVDCFCHKGNKGMNLSMMFKNRNITYIISYINHVLNVCVGVYSHYIRGKTNNYMIHICVWKFPPFRLGEAALSMGNNVKPRCTTQKWWVTNRHLVGVASHRSFLYGVGLFRKSKAR